MGGWWDMLGLGWLGGLIQQCAEGGPRAYFPQTLRVEGVPPLLMMEVTAPAILACAAAALVALGLWVGRARPWLCAVPLVPQALVLGGGVYWAGLLVFDSVGAGFKQGMTPWLIAWLVNFGMFVLGAALMAGLGALLLLVSDERRLHGAALIGNAVIACLVAGGWIGLRHMYLACL